MTFLSFSPPGCEKLPLESNPIPYPEYLHVSISEFFVNLIAPNRQFSKVMLDAYYLELFHKQCKYLILVHDCM